MSWVRRHRLREYVRNSIWMFPSLGIVAAVVSVNVLHGIATRTNGQPDFAPESARALFGALAGAMFTFVVFVSSILLMVLQLAGAQLTPRMIGFAFRDRVTLFTLTVFTFTFTFTLGVLLRIGDRSVPALTTHIAAYLSLFALADFLYLINHIGRFLRASGALLAVARMGHEVIESVYPRPFYAPRDTVQHVSCAPTGETTWTVPGSRHGVLLAFDRDGLVELARKADCVVELIPQVGDFVAAESPLFRVYGGQDRISARALCRSVALGQERTMEQDPAFAFRIIVDIASKGLSPAVNDPTTAVQAIDQIHHLLGNVGSRSLHEGLAHDQFGTLRLLYRTPDWEDFVRLAVTEIRQFGGKSIQVVRRLGALLESLSETVPPERSALLRRELALLRRSTDRLFAEPEDRALAGISDLQGVGGKHVEEQPPAEQPEPVTASPNVT